MNEEMGKIINLPPDLLPREEYMSINSIDKERYVYKTLKKILELNTNGVMISTIVKATRFSHATIWHHLEKMTATRESYKLNYGTANVYFANGKMIHHLNKSDLTMGDKTYSFYFVKNNFGNFMYIQEKKENRLGGISVDGGLIIPIDHFHEFIEKLKEVETSKEVKQNASSRN